MKEEIFIEMLLDKVKLARLLFYNKRDKTFIEKLVEEDFTTKISFHKIPLTNTPNNTRITLINQY